MDPGEYVLGVDIGTASSKGVLCTTSGAIVRQAQHALRAAATPIQHALAR